MERQYPAKKAGRIVFALLLCCSLPGAYAQTGSYDWDSVPDAFPGIRMAETSVTAPRLMKIYCLRIDAHHAEIRFYATPRSDAYVENGPWEVTRKTTRNFLNESRAAGMNMVAATHAAPWAPWPALCMAESDANVTGLLVSDGVLVSPTESYPSFIVNKSGGVAMRTVSPSENLDDIWVAISGFGLVLVDGVALSGGTDLHPRTGIGVCEAGRYAYWLTIDGRQTDSEGATTSEVGDWLRYYGAHTGANMDGGGSTTLVLWDENSNEERIVNTPVGCGDAGTERAIGGNLGVYLAPPPEVLVRGSRWVEEGTNAVLSLQTTVTGNYSVQWYKDDEPIDGANGNDYLLTPATPDDTGLYHVVVTDAAAFQHQSRPFHLIVYSEEQRVPAGKLTVVAAFSLMLTGSPIYIFRRSKQH